MPSLRASLNGAIAGAAAAGVWALQQPLDKRVFGSDFDDVELLGKALTREEEAWPAVGSALHLQNGAAFGAVYSVLRPHLPGPLVARAITMAMIEHMLSWPLVRVTDRYHPARDELPVLTGNGRAFAQAAWRHFVFGAVLGELERRLNPVVEDEKPPEIPVSSNGHGHIELAVEPAETSS